MSNRSLAAFAALLICFALAGYCASIGANYWASLWAAIGCTAAFLLRPRRSCTCQAVRTGPLGLVKLKPGEWL